MITRNDSTSNHGCSQPAGPAHEQLERRVGHLEVVALVLHPLQRVDELVELRAVEVEPELLRP